MRIVERMWFNAANSSTWYLVPGLIALIITLVGAFLTSLVVAREWGGGRWSPFSSPRCAPRRDLAGQDHPYFLVGLLGLSCAWCRPACCSAYRYRGSLVLLLFRFHAVSVRHPRHRPADLRQDAPNQFLASQVAISSFLPALMLSGLPVRPAQRADLHPPGRLDPASDLFYGNWSETLFLAGTTTGAWR
ncbi:hypothetical protein ACPA9J_27220 [Pseudomonas aeruginosa]